MLQTLRIWRWTIRNGIGEWPWRKPGEILDSWKFDYKWYGPRTFLRHRLSNIWGKLHYHLYYRHQAHHKRALRRVYLESSISTLETLRKWAEEKADGLDQKVP